MGQRQFVLFGIAGVVALVMTITVIGLNDNLTYYLYPNEAVRQRADFVVRGVGDTAAVVALGHRVGRFGHLAQWRCHPARQEVDEGHRDGDRGERGGEARKDGERGLRHADHSVTTYSNAAQESIANTAS